MMTIEHNVSLKKYNTFGIEATARDFAAIRSHDDLMALLESGLLAESRFLILGGGSNVVFSGDFDGLVVRMECDVCHFPSNDEPPVVTAAAGKVMDQLVRECAARGLHGLENLAAIPGTVGASAVQNVGAYGVEAKDCICEVLAYEIATGRPRRFSNEECGFGYRQSIFKDELKDRYIIEQVSYRLQRQYVPVLGYKALEEAIAGRQDPSAMEVIDAISEVRWNKLPRPEAKGSAGSFFKNPVVSMDEYERIAKAHPGVVAFDAEMGRKKLSAGWLIEHCGWKGRTMGHAGVYDKQALVLVNADGQARGEDVMRVADAVIRDVEEKYGVILVPEAILV